MPGPRRQKQPPIAHLPTFMRIPVARIIEPALPARVQMSGEGMSDLIESMREVGQIEPITVEQHEGMFELITGHRRYLAARSLQWSELNAMVWAEGTPSKLAMMLHENSVREALNPAEEAIFMAQAQEQLGLDEQGLMKTFKRGADYVAGRLALLRGDKDVFLALQAGEINIGVAHELNRITDHGMLLYYLDCAKRSNPPARVVHQWVNDWKLRAGAQLAGKPPAVGAQPETPGADGDGGVPVSAGAGSSPDTPAEPKPFFGCELCGGDRDPYNLVTVRIHMWEWDRIQETVRKVAQGG